MIFSEIGTHADAGHSTCALGHLRRGGSFHAVFFRPGGDIGRVHVGGKFAGKGGSMDMDWPL